MTEPIDKSGPHSVASSVEALLASIESKTVSSTDKRLLKAARAAAPQRQWKRSWRRFWKGNFMELRFLAIEGFRGFNDKTVIEFGR